MSIVTSVSLPTLRQSANETSMWLSVAYGNGIFVSVSSSAISGGLGTNIMYSSDDGVSWTGVSLGSAFNGIVWSSICFGNGRFVAVSSGPGGLGGATVNRVAVSTNGYTWTGGNISGGTFGGLERKGWKGITCGLDENGNSLFVAVANSGNGNGVMTSPDGLVWTGRPLPNEGGQWVSVAYGLGYFVACAVNGLLMISTNGTSWTVVSGSPIDGLQFVKVRFGNGRFIAMTSATAITSTNATTWISLYTENLYGMSALAFGNGVFISIGLTDIYFSVDGTPFSLNSTGGNGGSLWVDAEYGNGTFVAVKNALSNRVLTLKTTSPNLSNF